MLLLTRESRFWRRLSLVALVVVVGIYLWFSQDGFAHGGSPVGLALGVGSLILTLFLLFLGIRKRWHRSRLGTLRSWTQAHIYLGLLVVIVTLLHSGFRFEDRIAVAALLAMVAVVVTGMVGVVLYSVVPFLLTRVETGLSLEEASLEINQLTGSMSRLASGRSPQLQELTRELLSPAQPGFLAGWRLVLDPPRRSEEDAGWSKRLAGLPPADEEVLRQILVLRRQFRELQLSVLAQQRYRNLLALWLYLHVPLCALLIVLVIAHLFGVAYYSDASSWLRGFF